MNLRCADQWVLDLMDGLGDKICEEFPFTSGVDCEVEVVPDFSSASDSRLHNLSSNPGVQDPDSGRILLN